MNVEQEIKQLKKEERLLEKEPCTNSNDLSWIIPTVIIVFLVKYFATGSGFNLGALSGYWWLIFFLPMIFGAFSDEDEIKEKSPS